MTCADGTHRLSSARATKRPAGRGRSDRRRLVLPARPRPSGLDGCPGRVRHHRHAVAFPPRATGCPRAAYARRPKWGVGADGESSGVPVARASAASSSSWKRRSWTAGCGACEPLVVPVAAGAARLGVVTGGEPHLGDVPEAEVVGGTGAAHPRRHPAGVDRVAEHVRPQPGDGDSERGDEELAVRVGAGRAPPAPDASTSARPPRCMPLLRYTRRDGRWSRAVSR